MCTPEPQAFDVSREALASADRHAVHRNELSGRQLRVSGPVPAPAADDAPVLGALLGALPLADAPAADDGAPPLGSLVSELLAEAPEADAPGRRRLYQFGAAAAPGPEGDAVGDPLSMPGALLGPWAPGPAAEAPAADAAPAPEADGGLLAALLGPWAPAPAAEDPPKDAAPAPEAGGRFGRPRRGNRPRQLLQVRAEGTVVDGECVCPGPGEETVAAAPGADAAAEPENATVASAAQLPPDQEALTQVAAGSGQLGRPGDLWAPLVGPEGGPCACPAGSATEAIEGPGLDASAENPIIGAAAEGVTGTETASPVWTPGKASLTAPAPPPPSQRKLEAHADAPAADGAPVLGALLGAPPLADAPAADGGPLFPDFPDLGMRRLSQLPSARAAAGADAEAPAADSPAAVGVVVVRGTNAGRP